MVLNVNELQREMNSSITAPLPYRKLDKAVIEKDLEDIELDDLELEVTKSKSKPRRQVSPLTWAAIKAKYVYGTQVTDPTTENLVTLYPTLPDLAVEYDVSLQSIRNHSSKDNWREERQIFAKKIVDNEKVNLLNSIVSKATRYDEKHLKTLDRLHSIIDSYFEAFESYGDEEEGGETTYPVLRINVKDLASIMTILNQSHTLVRNIVGEPINAHQLLQDIQKDLKSNGSTGEKTQQVKNLASRLKTTMKLEPDS
jgi:hypothetical protein